MKKCGLVIPPQWPWLGCSPDGIIFEGGELVGCIAVKCPYAKKDMTAWEAALNDSNFCLLKIVEGKLKLNKKHNYIYQCQGVLNLLGLDWICFVLYTTKDMYIKKIHNDTSLWSLKMLPSLTNFFIEFILPKI